MPIGPDKNLESISLKVAEAVSNEGQRMSLVEVRSLCQRLVESFQRSIAQAEPQVFYEMLHQILQRVAEQGDDLHIWQDAITVLRWSASHLVGAVEARLPTAQLENMLHQARLEISESARGQYARLLFERTSLADRVGWMSARFLTAQDMGEVFDLLDDCLPDLGIQKAAVAFFEPQGEDPVAWSQLLLPKECLDKTPRFPSRQFPPLGLCSPTEPFQFILLPLLVQEGLTGFVAFQTRDLSSCADIVRPLAAALRGAHLFQETLQATHQAEEGRRLAEEANRLKSRFLSTVSHELRTPLNLISGISDILRHENSRSKSFDPDLHQKDLERIYLASQHLDSLIRDVLDLARSETGQLSLTLEPIALGEVLSAADAIGEQLARDKELSWHSQFPADLPQVFGDRTRLRQVLLNLITNAVKFTQQGEISLSAWEADGEVIVQVQDTGLGIPLDEQKVIFNEFRQSGRTTRRGYGGLGLGLAICKRLVELHGGRISVYSSGDEGAGSTFSFTLPVKPVSHEAAIQAPGTDLRQVLLLVQDEQSGQRLKEHLESNCIHVCLPELDSDSAWLSQLDQATPDMIIMDSSLASEQGWKILKLLKDNPHTSHIPVISFALGSESGSLLELDYLTKPLGAARLAEVLVSHGFFERGDDKQKTILVVDDEPDILDLQTRLIETQLPGYGVLRACDGREALRILGSTRPALVLLDLMMPELDGFGVLEAMRANPDTCSIPVIVLTSQSLTEADMARLNHGVSYVLGKGVFTVNETLERITNALSRKRKPGSEIQRAVLKAMAFIHTHYSEPISRSMIAAHIGMSERHLTRCFNQEIGVTPITYLNRYRVHQAKVLLDVGEKSITDIALEVGFSSSGYFTRVFRQEIGLSPRAYLHGNCPPS